MSIKSAQISNILGLAARSLPAPAAPDATEHRDLSLSAREEGFSSFYFFPSFSVFLSISFSFDTTREDFFFLFKFSFLLETSSAGFKSKV